MKNNIKPDSIEFFINGILLKIKLSILFELHCKNQ